MLKIWIKFWKKNYVNWKKLLSSNIIIQIFAKKPLSRYTLFFLDKTWIKSKKNHTNQRWTGLLGFREPILPLVRFWCGTGRVRRLKLFSLWSATRALRRLIHTWNKTIYFFWTLSSIKNDNLQYNTMVQVIFWWIVNKTVGCWLGLRAIKTLYFYFCKVIKN